MSGWDLYLLGFSVVFAAGPLLLRTALIWRRTGRNPVHLESPDTPMGCVQLWLGLALVGYGAVVGLKLFWPAAFMQLPRFAWLGQPIIWGTGVGLTLLGLLVAWLAQAQMGASWRFGVDQTDTPPLVTSGIFGFSRNPIYLAIMLAAIGVFLLLDDALTLALLVLAIAQLTILVRLEEAFLRTIHGPAYAAYTSRVGRFMTLIGR